MKCIPVILMLFGVSSAVADHSIKVLPKITERVHQNAELDSRDRLWATSNAGPLTDSGLFLWENDQWRRIDSRPCKLLRVVGDTAYVQVSKHVDQYEPAIYSTNGGELRYELSLWDHLNGTMTASLGIDIAGRIYTSGDGNIRAYERRPGTSDAFALIAQKFDKNASEIVVDGADAYLCSNKGVRWYQKGKYMGEFQHPNTRRYFGVSSVVPIEPGLLVCFSTYYEPHIILDLKNKQLLKNLPENCKTPFPSGVLTDKRRLEAWYRECVYYHNPGKPMSLPLLLEKWKPEEVMAGIKLRRQIDHKYTYSQMACYDGDAVEINKDGTIHAYHNGVLSTLDIGFPELAGGFKRALVDSKGTYYLISAKKIIRYQPRQEERLKK